MSFFGPLVTGMPIAGATPGNGEGGAVEGPSGGSGRLAPSVDGEAFAAALLMAVGAGETGGSASGRSLHPALPGWGGEGSGETGGEGTGEKGSEESSGGEGSTSSKTDGEGARTTAAGGSGAGEGPSESGDGKGEKSSQEGRDAPRSAGGRSPSAPAVSAVATVVAESGSFNPTQPEAASEILTQSREISDNPAHPASSHRSPKAPEGTGAAGSGVAGAESRGFGDAGVAGAGSREPGDAGVARSDSGAVEVRTPEGARTTAAGGSGAGEGLSESGDGKGEKSSQEGREAPRSAGGRGPSAPAVSAVATVVAESNSFNPTQPETASKILTQSREISDNPAHPASSHRSPKAPEGTGAAGSGVAGSGVAGAESRGFGDAGVARAESRGPGDAGVARSDSAAVEVRTPEDAGGARARTPAMEAPGPGAQAQTSSGASESRNGPLESTGIGSNRSVDASSVRPADGSPSPTAASGPAAPPPAHLTSVDDDLSKLKPEFKARLDRVIHRMETEHGHRVEVVEAYRSPERQQYLYTQGRSRSGPVVTWTRDSLHGRGRAADLRIDGSWKNPEAYSRLQRIAEQEGLHTLGKRDPGHLELPEGDSSRPGRGSPAARGEGRTPWSYSTDGSATSRTAVPARVASRASVARVARVATAPSAGNGRVTRAGGADASPSGKGTGSDVGPLRAGDSPNGARVAPGPESESTSRPRGAGRGEEKAFRGKGTTGEPGAKGSSAVPAMTGPGEGGAAFRAPVVSESSSTMPMTGADRVAEAMALKETAAGTHGRPMHLELENADGVGTRLRLDLRGSNLDATIDLQDPVSADRMRARVSELHRALARVGLDAEAIRIQAAARPVVEGMESLRDAQPGTAELFRMLASDGAGQSRNETQGGRSHREGTHRGHENGGRPRNPSQQNKSREERR